MEDGENTQVTYEEADHAEFDEMRDHAEFQQELSEDQQFSGGYPGQAQKESIFSWFLGILNIKNSSKVANLDKFELGKAELSVRAHENLSLLGKLLSNKSFSDFFRSKSEITLSTSMSKKGWLSELVVSQKKYSTRQIQTPNQPVQQPVKRGFLGFGKGRPQQ